MVPYNRVDIWAQACVRSALAGTAYQLSGDTEKPCYSMVQQDGTEFMQHE